MKQRVKMGQVIIDRSTAPRDLVGDSGITRERELLLLALVLDSGAPYLPVHGQDFRDVVALDIHLRGEAEREQHEADAADGHRRDQPEAGVSPRLDLHCAGLATMSFTSCPRARASNGFVT